jgi:hypothetical protein
MATREDDEPLRSILLDMAFDNPEEMAKALKEYTRDNDFGFRFWHLIFLLRGLKSTLIGNISWYRGMAKGIFLGVNIEAVSSNHSNPCFLLGLRRRTKGTIYIDQKYFFPIFYLQYRNKNEIVQILETWGCETKELMVVVNAMLDPRLLPLCMTMDDRLVREIVTRSLERA